MSDYGESDLDLLFTMFEGVMQAQEYLAMSLLHTGALDRAGTRVLLLLHRGPLGADARRTKSARGSIAL